MKKQSIIGIGAIAIGIAAYAGIRKLMKSDWMVDRKRKKIICRLAKKFFETDTVSFERDEDETLIATIQTSLPQKQVDQGASAFVEAVGEMFGRECRLGFNIRGMPHTRTESGDDVQA